jgi:hypothetical protein
MNERLFNQTAKLKLPISHVAEVGVYLPETSNVLGFINQGITTDLIEPDPVCLARISEYFGQRANIRVFPCAIWKERTQIGLYRIGASTFAADLTSSPALVNDHYQKSAEHLFYAEAKLFSDIDDGTIDLLSVDTEGCEWFVLMNMTSRPLVISIETHGKHYHNPYLNDIEQWMRSNGYKRWYSDRSDTVYTRQSIKTSFWSRLFG